MPDGVTVASTALAAKLEVRFTRFVKQVREEGAKATQEQSRDLHRILVLTSPVDTGRLRRSWPLPTPRGSDLIWGTGTTLEYAPKLEYGGYTQTGPRTVELGGGDLGYGFVADAGIYSTQAPLGFVRRALAQTAEPYRLRLETMLQRAWQATGGA